MGAIAGSWAGLHGPGEKTIEKAGQSDPGLGKGFRVWNGARGRGLQAALPGWEAQGASPCGGLGGGGEGGCSWDSGGGRGQGSGWGLRGTYVLSCQVGLSWDQTSIPGRPNAGAGADRSCWGPLIPGRSPQVGTSGVFWSRLHLGICFPKSGPPPSGRPSKFQATAVRSIRTGCWCRPRTPPGHLPAPGHWMSLQPRGPPAGAPSGPQSSATNTYTQHPSPRACGTALNLLPEKAPAPPSTPLHTSPGLTATAQGQGPACLHQPYSSPGLPGKACI